MGNFNRGGDRGGFGGGRSGGSKFGGGFKRGGFGGGSRDGGSRFGGDRGEVTMHDAVCGECQKNCQVPFRPTNEKPVYCKDCFTKRGGPEKPRFGDAPRRDFGNRDSRPPMRPAFAGNTAGGDSETKKLLEMINVKLDKLVKALDSVSRPIVSEAKVVEKVAPVAEIKKVVKEIPAVKSKKAVKKVSKK